MTTFHELLATNFTLWNQVYSRWLLEELFTFNWFIIVGSMVVIYVLLYLLIDRSRMREIFLYGSLLAVAFGYISGVGTDIDLWEYKTHLFPFLSSLFPFPYTFHPIIHMLAYQYASNWHSFMITNTIATAFFAFVAQPVYSWLDILWFKNWNYLYSFILSGTISFFARAVVLWMAKVEQHYAMNPKRNFLSPKLQPVMKHLNKNDEEK